MAVNESFAGKVYQPGEPYQVGREKIREFAHAIGAENPVFSDVESARRLGYGDLIAPPTFAVVIAQKKESEYISDPQAGIDFSRVVHGSEQFTHQRPIQAGDSIFATLTVDRIRPVGGHTMVTTRVELNNQNDQPVATVVSSLIVRGEE